MDEEKLSKIYDSLSDHDKRMLGLLGLSFVRGLHERIVNVLERYSSEISN